MHPAGGRERIQHQLPRSFFVAVGTRHCIRKCMSACFLYNIVPSPCVSGGTLNTWCSGYGVELNNVPLHCIMNAFFYNVPIPKVTCSIPVQTECKTSGSFSETAGESQSKDLHSLASALCGNSSNR